MYDKVITVQCGEHFFNVLDGDPTHADDGWDFWGHDFGNIFEPQTIAWIKEFTDHDRDMLDIGAWVGPTALIGSKYYRSVYAYEPDPIAFRYLDTNCRMNEQKNIGVYPYAIATTNEVSLYNVGAAGNSMSNMMGHGDLAGTIKATTLDDAMNGHDVAFIKMDIEGGEALVLPASKDLLGSYKPALALSLHYQFYRSDEEFEAIRDALSVYDNFNVAGHKIELKDLPRSFDVVLCS